MRQDRDHRHAIVLFDWCWRWELVAGGGGSDLPIAKWMVMELFVILAKASYNLPVMAS